jgi:hypothetical protein
MMSTNRARSIRRKPRIQLLVSRPRNTNKNWRNDLVSLRQPLRFKYFQVRFLLGEERGLRRQLWLHFIANLVGNLCQRGLIVARLVVKDHA